MLHLTAGGFILSEKWNREREVSRLNGVSLLFRELLSFNINQLYLRLKI